MVLGAPASAGGVRQGVDRRGQEDGLADPQGVVPGRRSGVRIRRADGAVLVDRRQGRGVRALRPDPRVEEVVTKRWYVVHAYSGFERSVQRALEDRIRRAGMEEKFGKILVPTEEAVGMRG